MEIIYPMFTLVVLTFLVGFSMGISRLISVRKGLVDRRYFKLLSGYEAPEHIVKLARNFSNLFEVPILFYTICILILVLGIDDGQMIGLAWTFVFLRLLHSIIHITYNNPFHRFFAFLVSSCVVLIMWVNLMMIIS